MFGVIRMDDSDGMKNDIGVSPFLCMFTCQVNIILFKCEIICVISFEIPSL